MTPTPNAKPEFSRPFALRELGRETARVSLSAKPDERAALAQRFGLLALDELSGDLSLSWREGGEILVAGQLHARATQSCIITLEPVPQELRESFRVVFAERPMAAPEHEAWDEEAGEEQELVEPLEGEEIDLGELLAQQLSVALPEYPRKAGAQLARSRWGSDPEGEKALKERQSPFSVLKALKRPGKT